MAKEPQNIHWRFHGFVTPAGGKDVQKWFDGLEQEERDEILDTILYLQNLPRHLWREPTFEAFDPEISEIKVKVGKLNRTYRIYGCFWPKGVQYSYTFLVGKYKKVKKDKQGEDLARKRLGQLDRKEATIHEFRFEEELDTADQAESGG
jgi:hypothetical protein